METSLYIWKIFATSQREREREKEGKHSGNFQSCKVELVYYNANQVTVYAI